MQKNSDSTYIQIQSEHWGAGGWVNAKYSCKFMRWISIGMIT